MKYTFLVLPGWMNSGPDHWQSVWARDDASFERVEQRDWETPKRDEWLAAINVAVERAPQPVVFVAHSLGCIAVPAWAESAPRKLQQKIAGAFLVAPADVERHGAAVVLAAWRPIPRGKLPFPSVVVASRNDEYLSFARARELAGAWGSALADGGMIGHINAASLGAWPDGQRMFAELMERIG